MNEDLLRYIQNKPMSSFLKTAKSYFDFLESLEQPGYNFFEVLPIGIQKLKSTEMEYTNIVAVPKTKQDSNRLFLNYKRVWGSKNDKNHVY